MELLESVLTWWLSNDNFLTFLFFFVIVVNIHLEYRAFTPLIPFLKLIGLVFFRVVLSLLESTVLS